MINYLYQTSDFNLFLILSAIMVAFSIMALFFIRALFPLHLRYQENAVIGCTSALIIVIYGVLAGFATLNLINNYNDALDTVRQETNAVANIYRDSRGLTDELRNHVQTDIKRYIDEVINVEWPLMNKGKKIDNEGDFIIEKMVDDINHSKIKNTLDSIIISDVLAESRNLYDVRQHRIQSSYTSLSNEIWVVILVGTILTLCVSYIFGVNFYLHIFIVISAALMMASIMFLLISLDKPFQGNYIVGPDVFKTTLAMMSKH